MLHKLLYIIINVVSTFNDIHCGNSRLNAVVLPILTLFIHFCNFLT